MTGLEGRSRLCLLLSVYILWSWADVFASELDPQLPYIFAIS
jgi:hypothetical protein